MREVCSHLTRLVACTRLARWQVFVGNGDPSLFACQHHLAATVRRKYLSHARRIVGREMTVRRIGDP